MTQILELATIADLLNQAFQQKQLDGSITQAMLPQLGRALEPVLQRYLAKEGVWPTPPVFCRLVNNFVQDGPRVQALFNTRERDEQALWQKLRAHLIQRAGKKWPQLSLAEQEEIVDEAWLRVHRYLPGFLFLSRLSSWVETILHNRGLAWWSKNQARLHNETSLDQPVGPGNSTEATNLGELLPADERPFDSAWEYTQSAQELWQLLEKLGDELDVTVLRMLYADGYKQTEIAERLQLSNAKITRHKQRMFERIANDEQIRKMVGQFGIASD